VPEEPCAAREPPDLLDLGHAPDFLEPSGDDSAAIPGLALVAHGGCLRRRSVFPGSLAVLVLNGSLCRRLGLHFLRPVRLLVGPGEPPGERCRATGIELVVLAHEGGLSHERKLSPANAVAGLMGLDAFLATSLAAKDLNT
jgi:hypothetical protein